MCYHSHEIAASGAARRRALYVVGCMKYVVRCTMHVAAALLHCCMLYVIIVDITSTTTSCASRLTNLNPNACEQEQVCVR
jgi:hypothetical protein